MNIRTTTHHHSFLPLPTRGVGISALVVALGLAACDDEGAYAALEDDQASEGLTPEDEEPAPAPEDDEPDPPSDEDESGGEDDCEGDDAPAISSLEVTGFDDFDEAQGGGDSVGSLRFVTQAGATGEIRVSRGAFPRVEFLAGDEIVAAIEIDLAKSGGPAAVGGACTVGFAPEAISYVEGDEQVVQGAIASGVFELYDDALGQAEGVSPGFAGLFVAVNGDGQQASLSCEQWCDLGASGAGAAGGAWLGALGGGVPGAIGGALIGACAGKMLMWDCIAYFC